MRAHSERDGWSGQDTKSIIDDFGRDSWKRDETVRKEIFHKQARGLQETTSVGPINIVQCALSM